MEASRLSALLTATREISSSLAFAEVAARLLEAVVRLAGARGARIALEPRGDEAAIRVERGETRGEPARALDLEAPAGRVGRLELFAGAGLDADVLALLVEHGALALANALAHEDALRRAERDTLTGLSNHGHLWAALEREANRAERYHRALAFVMIDIDRFKSLNDRYGHLAGDSALSRVARLVRERSRASDTAGRYGGDELALVLPETAAEGAVAVAEKIRAAAETLREGDTPLTLSVGVACAPADGKTAADLVRVADARLYRAKAAGGNRVVA